MSVDLSASRVYPVAPDRAFALLLPLPLSVAFGRPYGPLPAVRATVQYGEWTTAGQQRLIYLSGPGTVREVLTSVLTSRSFGYRLCELTGPLALLVTCVDGRWDFEPAGTGTRITWTWKVVPTLAGRPTMWAFARLWRGYARQVMDGLESSLVAATSD